MIPDDKCRRRVAGSGPMALLIDYLSTTYSQVVEVGIGAYTWVARQLRARGLLVVAVDLEVHARDFPIQVDDIQRPRLQLYRGAEAVYAIRPPPEILPPLRFLAHRLQVDLIVRPLAGEAATGAQVVSGRGDFFYFYPAQGDIPAASGQIPAASMNNGQIRRQPRRQPWPRK